MRIAVGNRKPLLSGDLKIPADSMGHLAVYYPALRPPGRVQNDMMHGIIFILCSAHAMEWAGDALKSTLVCALLMPMNHPILLLRAHSCS